MGTLNDVNVVDNVTDVLAAQINALMGSNFRSDYSLQTTMGGTVTLTDADYAIQSFLCNGANRIVKMPAYATTNHPYFIINATAATYTLDVQTNGGVSLLTKLLAANGGVVLVIPDGTAGFKVVSGGGGGGFWTLMPGTPIRTANTTFTITGDYTTLIKKGMIIKWAETGTTRWGMVSIPSTYGAPNTTVTIIGSTMASIDASSLNYALTGAEPFAWKFAMAGTVGTIATDIANARYAEEPMIVLGADLQVGTAGTTNNTTIDLMKNGSTMFTTKPTLATTVASFPTPFTADTAQTLALGDRVRLDTTAIQTTAAIDLYVTMYVFPSRYEFQT